MSIRYGYIINCENRNDPDLVQAFLKKWWVELDFKAPNLPLSPYLLYKRQLYLTFIRKPYLILMM
jgi:hypothetical protein